MAREEAFGEFLRASRLKAGFGLRAFAEETGMQASNLSSIEHGRVPPPQDKAILEGFAELLGLDDADRARLFDLAVAGKDRLPADVAEFAAKTPGIPVLLRTIENRGLKPEELERLTEYVNRVRRKR